MVEKDDLGNGMKYRAVIGKNSEEKWRLLEVSLGSRGTSIENEVISLLKFLSTFMPVQQARFKEITGLDPTMGSLDLKLEATIQSLMMKKFIDSVGLPIIQEAIRRKSRAISDIYLDLLEQRIKKGMYPEAIYVYSIFRGRGTPRTWLSIREDITEKQIEKIVDDKIGGLSRSLTKLMKASRKPLMSQKVNGYLIHLLSKPIGNKVMLAENGNADVSRISYSLLVVDLKRKKIGIVTGSKKEVLFAQRYLVNKMFKDALGPARNDVSIKGIDLLHKLVDPKKTDNLTLQSIDFKSTALENHPAFKLQADGNSSIEDALKNSAKDFWAGLSITALREVGFTLPTDAIGNYKRLGIYTHSPDDWDRITLNTTHGSVTSRIENQFLDKINKRLDGNDIKESRFVIAEYTPRYVIDKLLRHKTIPTTPAIPKEVDEFVVRLNAQKLIVKQGATTKRKCWNQSCFTTTWDQLVCPKCGQTDMRIIGEAITIYPNEQAIIKQLSESSDFPSHLKLKHYPGKQRNNEKKSVLAVLNEDKNLITFVVLVANTKDITFVKGLCREGLGVVAIIDPKMDSKADEIELLGATAIQLTDIVLHLLGHEGLDDLLKAIKDQEESMLKRVFDNAKVSVRNLDKKVGYDERIFEIDIKNIVQALVPDVVRLGTDHSGKKVPDGYLRYGVAGKRTASRSSRLLGWDAKYSATRTYRLGTGDTRKQNGYIDWLTNPTEEAYRFGHLGIYAIIANFEKTELMNTTLTSLAGHPKLKRGRVALIEDRLIMQIGQWMLNNWQQVLENNSLIADEVFAWFKRPPRKGFRYTVSRETDWDRLKKKIESKIKK